MRVGTAIILSLTLTGCGPLFVPMAPTLQAEDQRQVDQMWDNLLTPVQRVDRQTLLDANVAYWMYAIGVDRMHMTSEKYFSGGTAVMEIDCDRANPDADQFTITILDDRGRTVRRERYSRADVEESARMLRGMSNIRPTDLRSLHANIESNVNFEIGAPATQTSTAPADQLATPATPSTSPPATAPTETADERAVRMDIERRVAAVVAATQPARIVPSGSGGGAPRIQNRRH
jgi:hypothetical protein